MGVDRVYLNIFFIENIIYGIEVINTVMGMNLRK
jgi:hypothetical protein